MSSFFGTVFDVLVEREDLFNSSALIRNRFSKLKKNAR